MDNTAADASIMLPKGPPTRGRSKEHMNSANDNDMTLARRIHVLEHGIERSLGELTEVEAALRSGTARRYPRPMKGAGLERRRMMLLKLIEEMGTKLNELKAEHDSGTGACG
jgi:hypothetical protein